MYYIVNTTKDEHGFNEVHKDNCPYKPDYENQCFLGCFNSPKEAISAAKARGYNADGCGHCCPNNSRG